MTDAEIDAVARELWPSITKCDLRDVGDAPCSLDDECHCWPKVKERARSVIATLDRTRAWR